MAEQNRVEAIGSVRGVTIDTNLHNGDRLVIFIVVLAVTLMAISKGYNYKHEVDPLPETQTEMKEAE